MGEWPCCECCADDVCEMRPHTSPCDECQPDDEEASWRARAEAAEAERDALRVTLEKARYYASGYASNAGHVGWLARGFLEALVGDGHE